MGHKQQKENYEELHFPSFSKVHLEEFGIWLEKFKLKKVLSDGKSFSYLDVKEAGVEFGAYSKRIDRFPSDENNKESYSVVSYAVIIPMAMEKHVRPYPLELFEDKLEQYRKMVGREEFIEMKKMQGYEKTAEEMTLPKKEEVFDYEPITK